VLFVGNPELPRKNLALARAVQDELLRRGRRIELRIAWEIDPQEIVTWMSAADALLFPSLFEGSPNTVKEAMAMELPIVSAPVGDVPERLRGVAGTFVAPRETGAMADALDEALQHDRVPAARAAVSELSVERVAERLLSLYGSIARAS
jgi:glycosyltransferase involved in cell wall biosynthesis